MLESSQHSSQGVPLSSLERELRKISNLLIIVRMVVVVFKLRTAVTAAEVCYGLRFFRPETLVTAVAEIDTIRQ